MYVHVYVGIFYLRMHVCNYVCVYNSFYWEAWDTAQYIIMIAIVNCDKLRICILIFK